MCLVLISYFKKKSLLWRQSFLREAGGGKAYYLPLRYKFSQKKT